MRGRQAGSWAVFHSQNQDPPRSASWLASQAPSPVASPLRWRVRVAGRQGRLLGGGAESQGFCLHGRQPSFSLRPPSSPSSGSGARAGAWGWPWRTPSSSGDRLASVPGGPEARAQVGQPAPCCMGPFLTVVPTTQAGTGPRRKEEKGVRQSRCPAGHQLLKPAARPLLGYGAKSAGSPGGLTGITLSSLIPDLEPLGARALGTGQTPEG